MPDKRWPSFVLRCVPDALRRWRGNASGGIAVTFAMSLPMVLAMVGIASDYAMMKKLQAELQFAADAAAMAGAREIPVAKSNPAQVASAVRAFAAYHITGNSAASNDQLSSKGMSLDVAVADDFSAVEVSISEVWTPFFMHFVAQGVTPVSVTSKARFVGRNNICLLGLATGGTAVLLDNKSTITANGCGVFANSTASNGFRADQKSEVTASIICSAGGASVKGSSVVTPEPLTDCPPVADPLAGRAPPAVGSCDHKNMAISSAAVTLKPGVYCGGISISGSSSVVLEPGEYIIKDGGLNVQGTSSLSGTGVGFYITGKALPLVFASTTTISLEAPEDGPMAGLLIFEDRNLAQSLLHRITSDNARMLLGTIYLPVGSLLIDASKPVADQSAYTAIVARSIDLNAGPNLILNSNYGATDVPVPDGIAGTSQVILQN